MSEQALIVFTTVEDGDAARTLAQSLVAARVVACVNILPDMTSVFRWESGADDSAGAAVQAESEVMLLMKTTAARYPALEARIRDEHPYELPEILAVPVDRGLPAFIDWIAAATPA